MRKSIELSMETIGKRVKIYRNFHTGNFSVMVKNKVVGHVASFMLENAKFLVSEPGRQRFLSKNQKVVHAYVTGILVDFDMPYRVTLDPELKLDYNPSKMETFRMGETPIYKAKNVVGIENKIYLS